MTKRFTDVVLVGEKVRLRPLRLEDAQAAHELLSDARVTRTLSWDVAPNVEELARSYGHFPKVDPDGSLGYDFAIERLGKPGFCGPVGAGVAANTQQVGIGYWLGVPHWGQGLATDAARLVVHLAFQHLEAERVWATVFVGNHASRRVLEKNGFQLDGTLRHERFKAGEWIDIWFFTLLRLEWEAWRDWYRPREERVVAGR